MQTIREVIEWAGRRNNSKTVVDQTRMWKGQWKRKKREHERNWDLRGSKDEFLSGMKPDEKFTPVITLVVYYGEKDSWDGARCLHDLLDIDDKLKQYVTNYRLNLYNCHEHDSFDEYHTELRQVFETIRYAVDKKKLQEIVEKNKEAYSRIDSDTRELLEVVANVSIPEECKVLENGEERFDMCKAFEDMRLEGMELHAVELIRKKLEKGKNIEVIAEELEETIDKIRELIQKYSLV